MSCTGWRLGISHVIWPSIRSRREQPSAGTDCVSRKCVLRGDVVRRYTICRVHRSAHPRLRIYDGRKMIASMTVPSFEWGKAYVDGILKSSSALRGMRRHQRRR